MDFLTTKRLRVVNNCLTIIVALLGMYIIVGPFLPQINWWVKHSSPIKGVVGEPPVQIPDKPPEVAQTVDEPDKQLIIPTLNMNVPVYEGGVGALSKGVWRIPHTSSPDKGGNTVLAGHRFTYSARAVFYHLDKVKVGDRLALTWQQKIYEYEVFAVKVVPPTETSIENNTVDPQLTIYTCTPLLTAKDRLVVQAKLVETRE